MLYYLLTCMHLEKGRKQLDILASILEEQFKPMVREANLLSEGQNPDIWQTPSDNTTTSGGGPELSVGAMCIFSETNSF